MGNFIVITHIPYTLYITYTAGIFYFLYKSLQWLINFTILLYKYLVYSRIMLFYQIFAIKRKTICVLFLRLKIIVERELTMKVYVIVQISFKCLWKCVEK